MSIVFDILPEKPVKVKRIWIHFQVSSIVLTLSFCFVNFCFSKGNQNSTASIFIGVVPVLEIKPRSVTKRVGKSVCDTRYKLSLCGLLWYSLNNSVSLNTAVCLMHESHTSCMLILNRRPPPHSHHHHRHQHHQHHCQYYLLTLRKNYLFHLWPTTETFSKQ